MAEALQLFTGGITVEVPANCLEGARVKVSEASTKKDVWYKVAYAGADEIGDGVIYRPYKDVFSDTWVGTMYAMNREGTTAYIASGAITAFSKIYASADGKVAGSGTVVIGKALNSASANGRVDALFSYDCTDNIKAIGVCNFTVTDVNVPADGTAQTPITIYPAGATGTFTYSSATTANITVDTTGKLTAVGSTGATSVITVTCNGISRTCTATITATDAE